MIAPPDARYVVCRVAPVPGQLPGKRIAMVTGDRVHLRRGGVFGQHRSGLGWMPNSRALVDVEVIRDATKREIQTGMVLG